MIIRLDVSNSVYIHCSSLDDGRHENLPEIISYISRYKPNRFI